MCVLAVDTYGRGSGDEELVSFPLPPCLGEWPVPRPADPIDTIVQIGSLLKQSKYPQCWTVAITVHHLRFGRRC